MDSGSNRPPSPRETIGSYRLLEPIGKGGMGEVYLAAQESPIHRRVALKIIKRGMDTRQVIARFEAERQVLALLDHPNIAKILDAGEHDARPYFVMEYVAGVSITDHCDRQKLNTRERLELFLPICQAVQHAHQKGIIHRDIKPSNVLVALQDGNKPVPKVIDFGVAKATDQRLTEETLFTQHGVLIGTPEYMSPEQAEIRGLDVDTRTDIYSLGVLLYELLVGALPFDPEALRRAGYDEIRRIIREETPAKPSTRLSGLGDTANDIAQRRRTDLKSLGRQLRGDLEWITLKALEKDRTRRYATASELAADIVRHLSQDPVIAGPPSRRYLIGRFVRKHRVPVAAVVSIAFAVLLAGSTALWFGVNAQRSEREANAALLVEESLRLAGLAADELERGRTDRALLLALNALPGRYGGERPWVPQAEAQLAKAQRSLQMKLVMSHGARINSTAYSPDGTQILTASNDGTAVVWDLATGRQVVTLDHSGPVLEGTFNAEGTQVTTINSDVTGNLVTSVLWDLSTGAPVSSSTQAVPMWTRTDSPDGSVFAVPGENRTVVVLVDAATGERVKTLRHDDPVDYVYFDADGSTINAVAYIPERRFDSMVALSVEVAGGSESSIWTFGPAGGRFTSRVSPDGSKVATTLWDGTQLIWDVATGEDLAPDDQYWITALATDANGERAIMRSEDDSVVIQNLTTGETVAALSLGDEVSFARFSSDSRLVLTESSNTIAVWDVSSGARVSSFVVDGRFINAGFGRDGQHVVALSRDENEDGSGTLAVWDVETATRITTLDNGGTRPETYIYSFSISADGERVAVVSGDGKVAVWDMLSNTRIATLNHGGFAVKISFGSDRDQILTYSEGGTAIVWEARASAANALSHDERIDYLAFSPDGSRLLVSGSSDAAIVWDVASRTRISSLALNGLPPIWSPAGNRVVTTPDDRTAILWDVLSGTAIATLPVDAQISSPKFSSDGSLIATASRNETDPASTDESANAPVDGHVIIWDAVSGRRMATLDHDGPVWAASFNRDGRQLISASAEGTAIIWDIASQARIATFEPGGNVLAAALSSDGETLITLSTGRRQLTFGLTDTLIAWNVASGERVSTVPFGALSASTLSDDGRHVAISSLDERAIIIKDIVSGATIATFNHGDALFAAIAFSPDDTHVILTEEDRTVLFDIASGVAIAEFSHDGSAHDAAFSPDGMRFAMAFDDGTVELHDVPSGTMLVDVAVARLPINRTCLTPEERQEFALTG